MGAGTGDALAEGHADLSHRLLYVAPMFLQVDGYKLNVVAFRQIASVPPLIDARSPGDERSLTVRQVARRPHARRELTYCRGSLARRTGGT